MIELFLRSLERYGAIGAEEKSALAAAVSHTRTVHRDEDIVRDGACPTECAVMLEGLACRYKLLSEGRRQIIAFNLPGEACDLQALWMEMDHSVGALTTVKMAMIPHARLREVMHRHPGAGAALWRLNLADASVLREWIVGLGRRTAYGRVAHLVCELRTKLLALGLPAEMGFDLPLTQADVGDAVGLSIVHVNRVLQRLRAKGLVNLRGGRLTVQDWNGLLAAAEFDPAYLHLRGRKAPPTH